MSGKGISVIIAARNAEQYLPTALASVTSQTLAAYEIIVVDGRSTDQTVTLAESSGGRVITQPGLGLADAWNTGVSAARGEWIAFLDADDIWAPCKLRLQLACARTQPAASFITSWFSYFLEEGAEIPLGFKPRLLKEPQRGQIPGTLLIRRHLFESLGGFDTRFQIAHDVDWFARIKDNHIVGATVERVLMYKRVHAHNLSNDARTNNLELLRLFRASLARRQSERSS